MSVSVSVGRAGTVVCVVMCVVGHVRSLESLACFDGGLEELASSEASEHACAAKVDTHLALRFNGDTSCSLSQ